MIMPAKEPNCSKLFTNITHEAQNHWREIEASPTTKTARGALVTDDKAIIALLSFDNTKKQLSLTAKLSVKKELDTAALRQIIKYQSQHQHLCSFITVDDEFKMVTITANAPVYESKSSIAVTCIFNAACAILNDNELNELLN
ncbi:MAG: hypothetical protein WC770_04525 [Phycisphaerae bacterium]|jgi:hypothetical protein